MNKTLTLACVAMLALCGCQSRSGTSASMGPKNVLVVMNTNSPDSVSVAQYYMQKRHIASKYLCRIQCPSSDESIDDRVMDNTIRDPIRKYLVDNGLKDQIDYIVLTKGMPSRTYARWGIDSVLTCLFMDSDSQMNNPYFGAMDHFSHREYNMYLVTRLDGITVADAKALVDRSLAAKPLKGLFLLQLDRERDKREGYGFVNDSMRNASKLLKPKGLDVELYDGQQFAVRTNLMGYYGWGWNDSRYSFEAFKKLRFLPGSISDLAYSASAMTLNGKAHWHPNESAICDMVTQGVTGVKGYVQEPYATAIASADILFDRYTSGFNLAESFYAASRFVHWRDVILGDPLCAPYAKKK